MLLFLASLSAFLCFFFYIKERNKEEVGVGK